MFDKIKGAIRYAQARAALAKGNLGLAKSKIEDAKRLIGTKINQPNLYDLASEIYLALNDKTASSYHLGKAVTQILEYKRLSKFDRGYLLDYCDLLQSEINGNKEKIRWRVDSSEYHLVGNSILSNFPISWRPMSSRSQ